MERQNWIMDDEIVMHETIANQVSISEQEDAYAALETKYNNVEEAVEQDVLRAQFDKVDEDNVIVENYIEEDDSDLLKSQQI